jgi:peptidoglycan/LPS O-acetylase OafA/YrhL
LSQTDPNSGSVSHSRRWGIVAAGLLLVALALVVIYTTRRAFFSPLTLVVVAAIGLAALLLQLRLRGVPQVPARALLWLNVLAIAFAAAAVLTNIFHLNPAVQLAAALGAVVCFAISGIVVLNALRKKGV